MFEQVLEKMTAGFYFCDRDRTLADQSGIQLPENGVRISSKEALELAYEIDRLLPSVMYKRKQKQLIAVRNRVLFGFGPDLEQVYKCGGVL